MLLHNSLAVCLQVAISEQAAKSHLLHFLSFLWRDISWVCIGAPMLRHFIVRYVSALETRGRGRLVRVSECGLLVYRSVHKACAVPNA